MKQLLRSWTRRSGLYEHLVWSPPHRVFVRFNNPSYERAMRQERAFYAPWLRRGALVFDVGANVGSKSEVFLRLGARVVAVEPDRQCIRTLRRRFMLEPRHRIVPVALGEEPGQMELLMVEQGSAYNTLNTEWFERHAGGAPKRSVTVEVSTLERLVARWGVPTLLKIDVEGFEREVLRGLDRAVETVTFEANLDLFRTQTIECIAILARLAPDYRFNAFAHIDAPWLSSRWLDAPQMQAFVAGLERDYCEVIATRRDPVDRR